jgi:hypothetical protein
MSHFSVLVIGDNPEEQLAPFQENNMDDCPTKYLEFGDVEDEYLEQYKNESVEMLQSPSGELVYKWDKRFKVGDNIFDQETVIPIEYEEVEVRHAERYSTFEEYMSEHCGFQERDPDKNRFGYWSNPNSKWDWYQLGGRWKGFFKAKDLKTAILGESGVFDNEAMEGWADQLEKKNIDIEGMRNYKGEKAAEAYDAFHVIVNGREIPNWKEIREKYSEEDIDKARDEYRMNPVVQDMDKDENFKHYSIFSDIIEFAETRADYIQNTRNSALQTFAVVKDGKWFERGEMGWFGITHNEKDDFEWGKEFSKLIDNLPEDTLLSLYDCHI